MNPAHAAQVALPAIGADGQARIGAAHAVIVGLGGLGCPAALYLAAAGIGRLTLCDFDRVSESNLNRQILYGHADLGARKSEAAREALGRLHPDRRLVSREGRVDATAARALAAEADLVLDASDNFATRLAINEACLATRTPWVMGAAVRFEGQLMVFRPDRDDQPCYRCVYADAPDQLEDCAGAGVFGPVTGVIGAAMAGQALLLLAGVSPDSRFRLLDGRSWEWHGLGTTRHDHCEVCGHG